jgi:hypothetical protein
MLEEERFDPKQALRSRQMVSLVFDDGTFGAFVSHRCRGPGLRFPHHTGRRWVQSVLLKLVRLRATSGDDVGPRPKVLRMNVGNCLEIEFTNLLHPSRRDDEQVATRDASIHVIGMQSE